MVRQIFVDYKAGKDVSPGTLTAPVKTAARGLQLLRKLPAPRALVLRAGVHHLNSTLALQPGVDDGLTIRAHPGDTGLPWLSGALELNNLKWTQVVTAVTTTGVAKGVVWEADLSAHLPAEGMRDLHSLRLNGVRATAARYPNARIELDAFPTGYIMKAKS